MKRFFPIYFLLLLCVSCDDFLELQPETSLATSLVFDNVEGAAAVMNGAYSTLHSDWVERQYLFPEMWANNVVEIGTISNTNYQDALRHSVFTDFINQGDYLWELSYEALHLVNSILVNLPNIAEDNAAIANKKMQLEGEAYFIRGLIYFVLDRFWAHPELGLSVPIVLSPIGVDEQVSRATITEVHNQILTDLASAESLMAGVENNNGRATIWAVKALLARVNFYFENHAAAADYANQVIESGKFSLANGAVTAPYNTTVSDENIFTFLSASVDRAALNLFRRYSNESNNRVQIGISNEMWSQLNTDTSDVRLQELTEVTGDNHLTRKYDVRDMNIPYIRLAEMYLIRGEARAITDDLTGAIADLNTIKNRALLPEFTSTDKNAILAEFYSERTKELAFESGDNFFNLKRLAQPIGGMNKENAQTRFVFFIPEDETILHPAMVQNPIW